jgi:hypothetical protein
MKSVPQQAQVVGTAFWLLATLCAFHQWSQQASLQNFRDFNFGFCARDFPQCLHFSLSSSFPVSLEVDDRRQRRRYDLTVFTERPRASAICDGLAPWLRMTCTFCFWMPVMALTSIWG